MSKKYEKSSGGIVYRKGENGLVEILLLKWMNSKNKEIFTIPKGHIEANETAKDTAIREISEEAGLGIKDLEIIKFITKLNYTFTAGHLENSPLIDKDVYLFLVKYSGKEKPKVQKTERFVGYQWIRISEISKVDILFDLKSIIAKNITYFI